MSPVRPELLALCSSVFYAATLVIVGRAMRRASPFNVVVVLNTTVAVFGLSAAAVRGTLADAEFMAVLWFAVLGACGQGLGTITHFVGMQRMGVARATTIQSISPIWGALMAVLLLGERPGAAVVAGTLAVVVGVAVLAVRQEGDREAAGGWLRGALALPLISSLAYGLAPVFAKYAFAHQPAPWLGIGVAFASGSVTLLVARHAVPEQAPAALGRRGFGLLVLAGTVNFIAASMFWNAMLHGDISRVLPTSRLYPLWVLGLGVLFLGAAERVTRRTLAAVAMTVVGGILLTAFP